MTYFNNLGQGRIGWRSPGGGVTPSTLWTSVYGVWNADALGTSLDTNIFRVYNGDNVNDTSGNAQNGTNVGGVTFTTGKVGNAFTFNGSNYVSLPNNSLNFTTDFEIGFWMNLQGTGLDVQQPISNMQRNAGGSTVFGYGITIYTSTLDFQINNGSSTVSLTVGIGPYYYGWHYFQIQREWGVGSKIKINGVTVASNTSTVNPAYRPDVAHTPSIGVYKNTTGTNYFMSNGGKIDALTIWNRKLTDNESISLYNSGTGAEYPFSSQTLPTPNDAVGTNHGTLVNGASFTTGKIGQAFNFDGINDFVRLPNNSLNLTGDFSISMWVNWGRNNTSQILMSNLTIGGGIKGWMIEHASGQLRFRGFNSSGTDAFYILYSYVPPLNTWIHYTFVHKNNSNKMYANGALLTFDNIGSTHVAYASPNYPLIGANQYDSTTYQEYFQGKIDAVNVWNRELTAADVTDLYNAGTGKQYPTT